MSAWDRLAVVWALWWAAIAGLSPCPTCGQRPANIGKILRWANNLSDTQRVDLYTRLVRSQDQSHNIDPAAIGVALETFIRGIPA